MLAPPSQWCRVGPQFLWERKGIVQGHGVTVPQDREPVLLIETDGRLVPRLQHGHVGPAGAQQQVQSGLPVADDVTDQKHAPESGQKTLGLLAPRTVRIDVESDGHVAESLQPWDAESIQFFGL